MRESVESRPAKLCGEGKGGAEIKFSAAIFSLLRLNFLYQLSRASALLFRSSSVAVNLHIPTK